MKLKYPFDFEGQTITEITLRRPKAKDLRALDAAPPGAMDQTFAMVSICGDVPVALVEELDAEDFTALAEAVADFFPKVETPATGGA